MYQWEELEVKFYLLLIQQKIDIKIDTQNSKLNYSTKQLPLLYGDAYILWLFITTILLLCVNDRLKLAHLSNSIGRDSYTT